MNYKRNYLDNSYISYGFNDDDITEISRVSFDKNFIIEKKDLIISENDPVQIDVLLSSLNKYLKLYPKETIDTLIQSDFINYIYNNLLVNLIEFSNSILIFIYNIFSESPPEIIETIAPNDIILEFVNFTKKYADRYQIFFSILQIFIPLLNKVPSVLEILIQNDIWQIFKDIEESAEVNRFNQILQSKRYEKYINNSSLFQKAHEKMDIILQEEIKEDVIEIPEAFRAYSESYIEFYSKKKEKEIENREKKKEKLHDILFIEGVIEYRTIFFGFVFELVKVDYDSYPYLISIDDLFDLIIRNLFENQIISVISSIFEIFEFISDHDFDLFIKSFEKHFDYFKDVFIKYILMDNKSINRNSLLIFKRIIENNYDFFWKIINEDITYNILSTCFQRTLVFTNPSLQNKDDANITLKIIQNIFLKESSSSKLHVLFNDFIKNSGILNQICNLMQKSCYGLSSNAFKTFYICSQNATDAEIISLIQEYPIICTCIKLIDSEDEDQLILALNVILKILIILNNQNNYDHIFDSFQNDCDIEEFEDLCENENENISQLASSIKQEIMLWQKNHR